MEAFRKELLELADDMGAGHLECADRIRAIVDKYKDVRSTEEAATHEYANHPIVGGVRLPD